eukprot:550888-Amphidinium_carterae.1
MRLLSSAIWNGPCDQRRLQEQTLEFETSPTIAHAPVFSIPTAVESGLVSTIYASSSKIRGSISTIVFTTDILEMTKDDNNNQTRDFGNWKVGGKAVHASESTAETLKDKAI